MFRRCNSIKVLVEIDWKLVTRTIAGKQIDAKDDGKIVQSKLSPVLAISPENALQVNGLTGKTFTSDNFHQ